MSELPTIDSLNNGESIVGRRTSRFGNSKTLVLGSAESRMKRLVASFAQSIGPVEVTELLRLLLADLQLEAEYFGPALSRYLDDGYTVALGRRSALLLRAASRSLATLADWSANAAHASEKLETFEDWGSAWPMLEEINELLVARSLPALTLRAGSAGKGGKEPVTDVSELMTPLIDEWIAHLTTRFDNELDAAWQVRCRAARAHRNP